MDNVYLYDIDDLKEVVEENLAHRRVEAEKAQGIVDEEVKAFAFCWNRWSSNPLLWTCSPTSKPMRKKSSRGP